MSDTKIRTQTYSLRTRYTHHPVRPYVKADGAVDHDWFLVNIDGYEHARSRREVFLETVPEFAAEVKI